MKKIIMMLFLGTSIFLVNTSIYAQEAYYTTTGIPESSTLTLRALPNHGSKSLANIPHNTKKIGLTGKNNLANKDRWVQITFENQTGWVQEAYITKIAILSTPKESSPQAPTPTTVQIAPPPSPPTQRQPQIQSSSTIKEPPTTSFPWSARADSIYHNPHIQQQQTNVVPEPVIIIPPTYVQEIDLREEETPDGRYNIKDVFPVN